MHILSHFDLTVEGSHDEVYEFVCECAKGRAGAIAGGAPAVSWLAERLTAVE